MSHRERMSRSQLLEASQALALLHLRMNGDGAELQKSEKAHDPLHAVDAVDKYLSDHERY
jgi:hypothetical protein